MVHHIYSFSLIFFPFTTLSTFLRIQHSNLTEFRSVDYQIIKVIDINFDDFYIIMFSFDNDDYLYYVKFNLNFYSLFLIVYFDLIHNIFFDYVEDSRSSSLKQNCFTTQYFNLYFNDNYRSIDHFNTYIDLEDFHFQ